MEIRTNNHAESFHQRWNNAVGVHHPSIWTFIKVLKDQQSLNEVTIWGIRNEVDPPLHRPKWRRLEEIIIRKKAQYNDDWIDIEQYWRAITHLTLNLI